VEWNATHLLTAGLILKSQWGRFRFSIKSSNISLLLLLFGSIKFFILEYLFWQFRVTMLKSQVLVTSAWTPPAANSVALLFARGVYFLSRLTVKMNTHHTPALP
jgi:hypothetical protein